jgi:hypothetical protein
MNIPNFENIKFVDNNGFLTDEWKNILTQLFQQLQTNLSAEGISVPKQSNANIIALSTAKSIGNIIYDNTSNQFKACVPSGLVGVYKIINLI